MIDTFNDIPGLTYYVNTAEPGAVVHTGGTVTELVSTVTPDGDSGEPVQVSFFDDMATGLLQFTGDMVGAMPALTHAAEGTAGHPFRTADWGGEDYGEGALCWAVIFEPAADVDDARLLGSMNTNRSPNWTYVADVGNRIEGKLSSSTRNGPTSDPSLKGQPNVLILQWDQPNAGGTGPFQMVLNGKVILQDTRDRSNEVTCSSLCLTDSEGGGKSGKVKSSAYFFYTHYMSAQELADFNELCQVWIATGKGPQGPTSPSTAETTALTNDPENSTVTWQWAPDEDGPWVDLATVPEIEYTTSDYEGQHNGHLHIDAVTDVSADGYIRAEATAPYHVVTSVVVRLAVEG